MGFDLDLNAFINYVQCLIGVRKENEVKTLRATKLKLCGYSISLYFFLSCI